MNITANVTSSCFSWQEHFFKCLKNNTPYWGRAFIRTLASPTERLPILAGLVKRLEPSEELRILEIGSFAGASSVTLAMSLQKWHQGKGRIYCVDPWQYAVRAKGLSRGQCFDLSGRDITTYTYEDMFRFNIRAAGVEHLITTIKGKSKDVLPILAEKRFDLIYIDGDHSHAGAFYDISTAMTLVREGGYICGDDLEIQVPYDSSAGQGNYHLGVSQAVYDAFQRKISCTEGLWAQQKRNGWIDVQSLCSINPDWVTPLYSMSFDFLTRHITENGWKRIVLYGAGKHTHKLMRYLHKNHRSAFEIAAITDDHVQAGSIAGVKIVSPQAVRELQPDALIISSDAFEEELMKQALIHFPDIPQYPLYGGTVAAQKETS